MDSTKDLENYMQVDIVDYMDESCNTSPPSYRRTYLKRWDSNIIYACTRLNKIITLALTINVWILMYNTWFHDDFSLWTALYYYGCLHGLQSFVQNIKSSRDYFTWKDVLQLTNLQFGVFLAVLSKHIADYTISDESTL